MSMIATESLPEPIAAELREEVDVKPMSDAEFAAMQSQLKAENAEKEQLPEGTLMRYESTAAPVDDHSIWTYVEKVRKLIGIASPVVVPL